MASLMDLARLTPAERRRFTMLTEYGLTEGEAALCVGLAPIEPEGPSAFLPESPVAAPVVVAPELVHPPTPEEAPVSGAPAPAVEESTPPPPKVVRPSFAGVLRQAATEMGLRRSTTGGILVDMTEAEEEAARAEAEEWFEAGRSGREVAKAFRVPLPLAAAWAGALRERKARAAGVNAGGGGGAV